MFDACIFMREKQLRAVIVSSKVLEYESSDGSRRRMGVATPGETLGTLYNIGVLTVYVAGAECTLTHTC